MYAGAQIVATKLIHRGHRKEMLDAQIDDKTAQDAFNIGVLAPRAKTAMVVENRSEKLERKALAQERKQARLLEQQQIAQQIEGLMEKVIQETTLSSKDEANLRQKVQTIVTKVNKQPEKIDPAALQPSSNGQSTNPGAFLLWYDKNLH